MEVYTSALHENSFLLLPEDSERMRKPSRHSFYNPPLFPTFPVISNVSMLVIDIFQT